MVNHEINRLLNFALYHKMIEPEDKVWSANSLIGILGIHSFEPEEVNETFAASPDSILSKFSTGQQKTNSSRTQRQNGIYLTLT